MLYIIVIDLLIAIIYSYFNFIFFKISFIYFFFKRERGREEERGEKH